MTEKISTAEKGVFSRYLKYKLGENRIYLLFCSILNLAVLPLFSLAALLYANAKYAREAGLADIFPPNITTFIDMSKYIMVIALGCIAVAAVIIGPVCFDFYNRKNRSDTFGSLPVTHKQRFWGDFLAGYIITAGPVIPCGIISCVLTAFAESAGNAAARLSGGSIVENSVRFAFIFTLSLFFAVSFIYLFSVLASSVCGKFSGAVALSAALNILAMFFIPYWGYALAQCVIGFPMGEVFSKLSDIIPSPFLVGKIVWDMDAFPSGGRQYYSTIINADYAAGDIVHIIIYIVLFAAITALCFFITKKRKTEKTGELFAARGAYYAAAILMMTAVTGFMASVALKINLPVFVLVSVAVSVVLFVVLEVMQKKGIKKCLKNAAVIFLSTGAVMAFTIIFSATHGLGLSGVLPEADEIVSAKVVMNPLNYPYTINYTDKNDIAALCENLREGLRECSDYLETGGLYSVEFKLKDGGKFFRNYGVKSSNVWNYKEFGEKTTKFFEGFEKIPGYGEKFAEIAFDNYDLSKGLNAQITDIPVEIKIKPEKISEFKKIYEEEMRSRDIEKTKAAGILTGFTVNSNWISTNIYEGFDKTIAFIKDENNRVLPENPDDEVYYVIHGISGGADNEFAERLSYDLEIKKKHLDDPVVSELVSLIKSSAYNAYSDPEDYLPYDKVMKYYASVSASGYARYYFPREVNERAAMLGAEAAIRIAFSA